MAELCEICHVTSDDDEPTDRFWQRHIKGYGGLTKSGPCKRAKQLRQRYRHEVSHEYDRYYPSNVGTPTIPTCPKCGHLNANGTDDNPSLDCYDCRVLSEGTTEVSYGYKSTAYSIL